MQVKHGRDGGVTLRGTLASLAGGLLVGLCGGTALSLYLGGLFGLVGSGLDSVLGAVLQSPRRMIKEHWKGLNILVNALSSILTMGVALALDRFPALHSTILFALALLFCRVAEMPPTLDHMAVRAVALIYVVGVFYLDPHAAAVAPVVPAAAASALLLQTRFGKSRFLDALGFAAAAIKMSL
jgi:hypothetical protein